MKYLFCLIVGFVLGVSRELWWPLAVRFVAWLVKELAK